MKKSHFIQGLEKELGRPLTEAERVQFEQDWPEIVRDCQERHERLKAEHDAYQKRPDVTFMRQLKERQGTKMPDFDALYRRKAELDNDPRT